MASAANRELALQAARETITLLKNEGNVLPLDPSTLKTVAVIGPNADRALLGGYSGVPKYDVTVLQGIHARLGDGVRVVTAEGCKITLGGSWYEDPVEPPDPEEDRRQIAEAVDVAQGADMAGSCRSRSRARWGTFRRTTTTNRRPGAASCGRTPRRSTRSATA